MSLCRDELEHSIFGEKQVNIKYSRRLVFMYLHQTLRVIYWFIFIRFPSLVCCHVLSFFADPCVLYCTENGRVIYIHGTVNDGVRCLPDVFNYDVCIEGKCRVS